jgi:CRISPR/Cas system endoribonuclease Cas6 (RAMP superfamily)
MSIKEEEIWRALLAQSAPAFAGETEPPYGFTGRVLARARAERQQKNAFERMGLRAIMASLGVVACLGVVTIGLQMQDREDVDPAIKSMALVENVQVS